MRSHFLEDFIERKKARLELDSIEADGGFLGYASLFGTADLAGDIIEPGAFSKSLSQRSAAGIRMLYQHDPNQPIGIWLELKEDPKGLFVQGKLTSGVGRAREVFNLMKSGAIDGLSIGFKTIRAKNESKQSIRRIFEADLWEISIVTFPMLPGARIQTVKTCTYLKKSDQRLLARVRAATDMLKKRIKRNVYR